MTNAAARQRLMLSMSVLVSYVLIYPLWAQGAEDAEAGAPLNGAESGPAYAQATGGAGFDATVEDWDNDDADHFMCPISLEIMENPVQKAAAVKPP